MRVEIIFIIVGIFIAVVGLIIKYFRLYSLIGGYNTMTNDEKVNFDIKKFALLMRNALITIGILIVISSLISIWLNIEWLSPIVSIISVFVGVIYLNIQGARIKQKK